MEKTNGYRTKQRERILEYLMDHKDRHITPDDIVAHLRQQGTAVGKSTVYRYLDRLVEAGAVRKFFWEEGAGACYQYGGDTACKSHFHLKCLECGALIHMECGYLEELAAHIKSGHSFTVDPSKTVFYGICGKCGGSGERAHE